MYHSQTLVRFLPFGKPCPSFWMAISKQSIHVDQPEQMEDKNLDKPGDSIPEHFIP